MRASDIRFLSSDNCYEIQATISCGALREPFLLWYRFSGDAKRLINVEHGNFLLAALLLPAMQNGEAIELPTPISPMFLRSSNRIQAIFCSWDSTLVTVPINAPVRRHNGRTNKEIGLFFSLGVDSQYLLWRTLNDHPLNEDEITYIITIYGANLYLSDNMGNIFEEMLSKARAIADQTGKELISVTTNAGELLSLLGNRRGFISHETILASVGLALEGMFRKIYVASGETYTHIPPTNAHPVLTPLWSTESCLFVCDGLEASRLEKTRLLAQFMPAMDTLHVCWAQEGRFNCGRCAKCVRTMLELHTVGALERCRTLPNTIDINVLRKISLLIDDDLNYLQEVADSLGHSDTDVVLRETVLEILARWRLYFERVEKAKKHMNRLIAPREKFILVDRDTIRWLVGAARGAIPFLERDGQYWGPPEDDETAIREVERLQMDGAKCIAFWWADQWWLEYYAEFGRYLRSKYRCVLEDDSLVVFDFGMQPQIAAV